MHISLHLLVGIYEKTLQKQDYFSSNPMDSIRCLEMKVG